jgi:acetylornithine deacetylase/succinyl-diaminopimelate desuccinylase-like protein
MAYFELKVFGPEHDLHSGMFGGVVHNPAQALAELIAGMHDANGRITLPDYYDSVKPIGDEERKQFARLPIDDGFYLKQTGAPALWGEAEYTPFERVSARPTLEVHGLQSGFTGKGQKTVIPAWAMAKLSSRLVPNQTPSQVHQQLRRYLEEKAPPTLRWELTMLGGSPAVVTELDLPAIHALARALETAWGVAPVYKREGGSIPVVVAMKEILGAQSVITGFGLPDDNVHAPNEKLSLDTWYLGMEALVHFFYNTGEMGA